MIKIKNMVMISVFTALMCILTVFSPAIPISLLKIAITLQTLIVMITGIMLRPIDAFFSMLLYIVLGAIGLPVFSNFQSGLSVIIGPNGGFIIAFPFAAFLISLFKGNKSFWRLLTVNIIFGIVFVYILGTLSLSVVLKLRYCSTLISMTVFFIPDILKALLAAATGYKLKQYKIYNAG
ncbi:MAG: biotin transporter BioY [Bacilli bacterium]|nr:biotin transporter BioY [Bacilli bacterium]MDD4077791.1 biotin transporter BioY [Bacilli bacterium]MDD4388533.1 biotin transporter BioY [Bacilli bacterium]